MPNAIVELMGKQQPSTCDGSMMSDMRHAKCEGGRDWAMNSFPNAKMELMGKGQGVKRDGGRET